MVSFEEARDIIFSHTTKTATERVSLLEACGRVIAESIKAPWNLPLWDNSAMDGYAVSSNDCTETPCELKVNGFLPAGAKGDEFAVTTGFAVRIMTGAPIPKGCDSIVPYEETDNGLKQVTINAPIKKGQHIRFNGEDVSSGNIFITEGTVIRPPEISILASFGIALVPVYRRPVVAIISTGDELVELGCTPGAGQIINSNTLALAAAVQETGAIPRIIGIARDNLQSHLCLLKNGLQADVLITSAGVSAGDCDLVRDVLAKLGAEQKFWKVAIKPGGPTAFAMHNATLIFSLPGNPVSTLITFEEFVRPALLAMQGHTKTIRPLFPVIMQQPIKKKPGKKQIIRVRLEKKENNWLATSAGNQQTAILKTMVDAQALVFLPEEQESIQIGETVQAHFYGNYIEQIEHK